MINMDCGCHQNNKNFKFTKLPITKRTIKKELTMYGYPTNIISINSNLLWEEGYTGKGVKIAIIDSGIDKHSDLISNIAYRYSYVGEPDDDHGTHVASIIAANAKDGRGIYGVAPDASLYDLQILTRDGGDDKDYARAVLKAIDLGVDVINCSVGTDKYNKRVVDATKKACDAGIIVVAASGNEGKRATLYPAVVPDVLSVTNFDTSEWTVNKTSTINKMVDLAAPGTNIYGCSFRDEYVVMSGTSMAAPHISGICALLIQKVRAENRSLSKKEVRKKVIDMVMNNLIDVQTKGYDEYSGYGLFRYQPNKTPKFDAIGHSKYYYVGLKLGT